MKKQSEEVKKQVTEPEKEPEKEEIEKPVQQSEKLKINAKQPIKNRNVMVLVTLLGLGALAIYLEHRFNILEAMTNFFIKKNVHTNNNNENVLKTKVIK